MPVEIFVSTFLLLSNGSMLVPSSPHKARESSKPRNKKKIKIIQSKKKNITINIYHTTYGIMGARYVPTLPPKSLILSYVTNSSLVAKIKEKLLLYVYKDLHVFY